jgi:hypothetical protein
MPWWYLKLTSSQGTEIASNDGSSDGWRRGTAQRLRCVRPALLRAGRFDQGDPDDRQPAPLRARGAAPTRFHPGCPQCRTHPRGGAGRTRLSPGGPDAYPRRLGSVVARLARTPGWADQRPAGSPGRTRFVHRLWVPVPQALRDLQSGRRSRCRRCRSAIPPVTVAADTLCPLSAVRPVTRQAPRRHRRPATR